MLLIVAALALQSADQASCALQFDGISATDHRPEAVRIVCPEDVPDAAGLQSAADAAAAALDLDLPRADIGRDFASEAVFVRAETGWRPAPGQEIIVERPRISARAVEMGGRHLMCAAAFNPDAAGRAADLRVACITSEGDERDPTLWPMRRSMRSSLMGSRVLPTDMNYCLYTERYAEARVTVLPSGRQEPRFPPPDPADLPQDLCLREPD